MKRCIFLGILFPLTLFALPKGLELQSGTASNQVHGKHLHIQNSRQAILHWNEFSIARSESVHFDATALNRVIGKHSSHLLGKLTSDGMIFLINPNGVYIGAHASIKTGGFIASTADLSNEDFLKGDAFSFGSPTDEKIFNQGHIECPKGDIFLIAKNIQNEGTLTAQHVGLLSAQEVLIRPHGNERVLIRGALHDGAIENTGIIEALTIDLQTTSPYEKAIQHTGYIDATATCERGGRIYLIAEKGTATVNGSMASQEVRILGEEVVLKENTFIDASGPKGGTVLIGGDYQGKNPDVPNAQRVTVQKGATIHVDGTAGEAGRAILWGDEGILYQGYVSAQALGAVGDGGFVEVSSPGYYGYHGFVNALSKGGKTGTLLMDPVNVTIDNAGPTAPALPICPVTAYNPAINATILDADLSTQLGTCSVVINTSAAGANPGTVTFANPSTVTWGAMNDLTVNAVQNILVDSNAIINSTGSGNITLHANTGGTAPGTFIGLELNTGAQVLVDSGTLSMIAQGGDTAGGNDGVVINSGATVGTASSGTINITGTGGDGVGNNQGVVLIGVVSGGTNAVTITGIGQGTGTSNQGFFANTPGAMISTTTGDINLRGDGTMNPAAAAAGNANQGVRTGIITIQTTSGNIRIVGRGGEGPAGGQGIAMTGTVVTTVDGQISFIGSSLKSSSGIFLSNLGSMVSATGTGSVTFDGIGNLSPAVGVVGNGIDIANQFLVSTTSGALTMTGQGVFGGTGVVIRSAGLVQTTTGPVTVQGLAGTQGLFGVDINSQASIQTNSGNISITGSGAPGATNQTGIVITGTGSQVTSTSGNINMTGTGGSTGGTLNPGIQIDAAGSVTSTSGAITLNGTGGIGSGGSYGIGIENTGTLVSTSNGAINLRGTSGPSNQEGILINTNGVVTTTVSAPITLRALSDILIQTSGSVSAQGLGDVSLIADNSIRLETTSIVTANTGNLTLIVDNRFPTPPGMGLGAFILNAGATLTAGGQLCIYTARRSQNIINELVNGVPFIPGAFNVNTLIETWAAYFPNGGYGGLAFNFYYKEGTPVLGPVYFNNVAANLVQLPALLPIIKPPRIPLYFPNYHFQVCEGKVCAPTLSPYGSFIFEDALWWIGLDR